MEAALVKGEATVSPSAVAVETSITIACSIVDYGCSACLASRSMLAKAGLKAQANKIALSS